MALAYNFYTGDGVTTAFEFTKDLNSQSTVIGYVNDILMTGSYSTVTGFFTFDTAPASGATVYIVRKTDNGTAVATYPNKSYIKSDNLDGNQTQVLHFVQELQFDMKNVTDLAADLGGHVLATAASAAAALASETAAAASETAAGLSEITAAASEAAASLSETAAAASEAAAAISEANASASASAALTSETNAAASETAAGLSEAAAAASETAAGLSETAAALSETNAAASEASAAISETNAAASAATAEDAAIAYSIALGG